MSEKMLPDDFIAWLAPSAQLQCKCYNLPASVVIAQGAMESGWGEGTIGKFNLFGRKWGGSGPYTEQWTKENENEDAYIEDEDHIYLGNDWWRIAAKFQVYDSLLQAIDDWCILITQQEEYAEAYQIWCDTKDVESFVRALAPVYATDQSYTNNLLSTIRASDLTQYDDYIV